MRKIALLLVLLMLTSFAYACGGDGSQSSGAPSSAESLASSEITSLEESSEDEKMPVSIPEITEFYPANILMTENEVTINFTETQEAGHQTTITFVKKRWGTWNLNKFIAKDTATGKSVTLNPGGTDWEYVYTASKTQDGTFCFVGGNHGDEMLVDVKFYDAKSGEELKAGSTTANGIKIVEQTKICFQTDVSDEDSWTHIPKGQPFVNVSRTYLLNGVDIWLECDYDFTQKTYFLLSYTGMFNLEKATGNHIIFNNLDGTKTEFSTKIYGKGESSYGNPAPSVEIYGDAAPDFRTHIEIYELESMVENFKNQRKTFLWDMNDAINKLYFSKFSQDRPTRVREGTHWDTLIRWSFYKYKGE